MHHDVTNSLVRSQMEIDFNGIIRYPWRSATRNFKYESRARMSRIILLLARPRLIRAMSLQSRATFVQSLREKSHINSGRPRDTSCEYRDCDTDGTKSFSVMAVIMRGILPLEVFQLRHSAGLPFIRGTSVAADGEFFWWTISPGITFD